MIGDVVLFLAIVSISSLLGGLIGHVIADDRIPELVRRAQRGGAFVGRSIGFAALAARRLVDRVLATRLIVDLPPGLRKEIERAEEAARRQARARLDRARRGAR